MFVCVCSGAVVREMVRVVRNHSLMATNRARGLSTGGAAVSALVVAFDVEEASHLRLPALHGRFDLSSSFVVLGFLIY
jgi:hypothetical protein